MDYIELYNANLILRESLLKSLEKIPREELIKDRGFGWKSIRNCLVHILECEDFWVRKVLKKEPLEEYRFDDFNSIDDFRRRWENLQKQTLNFAGSLSPAQLSEPKEHTFSDGTSCPNSGSIGQVYPRGGIDSHTDS
ncbi:MAG: DinB family protein [Candidatus Zixiibacteriota bacterium]